MKLEALIRKHHIKPSNIWNFDEKGLGVTWSGVKTPLCGFLRVGGRVGVGSGVKNSQPAPHYGGASEKFSADSTWQKRYGGTS